ncbi:MAG: hypothetical protein JXR25_10235 [Pontiellaceae bacterium]|nr:hypothetical protein [Pontiellaceae bacterium]
MRESYPMGLNHVLAALKFLEGHGVIEVCGYTDKRELKIYRITNLGRNVMEGLLQERTDSVTESTPNRMP